MTGSAIRSLLESHTTGGERWTHPPGDGPFHLGAGKGWSGTIHTERRQSQRSKRARQRSDRRGTTADRAQVPVGRSVIWLSRRGRIETDLDGSGSVGEDGGDLEAPRALDVLRKREGQRTGQRRASASTTFRAGWLVGCRSGHGRRHAGTTSRSALDAGSNAQRMARGA